jgi:hypothetical protein
MQFFTVALMRDSTRVAVATLHTSPLRLLHSTEFAAAAAAALAVCPADLAAAARCGRGCMQQ